MTLQLEKKDLRTGAYTHNLYFNNRLISEQVYIKDGFIINDFVVDDFSFDEIILIRGVDLFDRIELSSYLDSDVFFQLVTIKRDFNTIMFRFFTEFSKINSLPIKERLFYKSMREKLSKYEFIDFHISEDFENFDNNYIRIDYFTSDLEFSLSELRGSIVLFLKTILNEVIHDVNGIKWSDLYFKNESLFTTNLVIPLLRKLGFYQVQYTHGVNEFGKDIIFSRIDEFGNKKFSAVQVKAGDMTGKVKGKVDEIIQQIDDAFKVPFNLTGVADDIYISSLIIIISGKFTHQAKIKIKHKVDKVLLGSITFLDKEDVMNLIYQD